MKKQKLKNLLKIGILTLGFTLLIVSCSKDQITKVELNEIQKIQNEFSLKDFENPFVKNNLQINWNNFEINLDQDSLFSGYEFNTILKANDFIESGKKKLFFKYKLEVLKIGENHWDFYIIKFITENRESLENTSTFLSNNFSGTIAHFNLNGELVETKGLEKGIKIVPNLNENLFAKDGPTPTDHEPTGGGSAGGGFQWIEVLHFTDWYKVYPDGSQEYTHSVYNYSTWEYVYVPNDNNYSISYHNHYSSLGYTGNSNHNNENIVVDKVDDSHLTGLAKCIYDKLSESNSNLFKATIGKFIDDPEYNLSLTIGECSRSDDACTNTGNLATTGEIIIKIEDNNTNPLQMAQYILHEAIHAEIFRFVSRYESGINPNNRPRLFELFKYYSELYDVGDIQHIYMTERYINPIASALRKLDGFKYQLDYYKAFAWDGLRVWDAGDLLNMDMDSKYEDYRKIVIKNTTISCD